jgi:GMP synthase-like glutamine amidotransferase
VDAGWLGELHPTLLEGEWGVFELDLDSLFAAAPERFDAFQWHSYTFDLPPGAVALARTRVQTPRTVPRGGFRADQPAAASQGP